MKLLVAGGAGFIGSNFIRYISSKYPDYILYCLDKLTYAGNLNNFSDLLMSKKIEFIKGDITNQHFIKSLFEKIKFDIVINFAAESHVDRSISGPQEFIETNYVGVFNLLEQLRKFPAIRYHQVSTDEVFGDLPLNQPHLKFNEESIFKPSSPYSASKAGADLLVKAYYRTYGLNVTTSHASNNYGNYQFPEKLIPLVINRAKYDDKIPVYGTGENIRDWIHVLDHCEALDLIIHKGRFGESYNIGGDNEIRNIDLIKTILRIMNKSEELIEFVKDRSGHDLRYSVDTNKIRNELGWVPKIDFKNGIKDTIYWYLNSQEWLDAVVNEEYKLYYSRNYE